MTRDPPNKVVAVPGGYAVHFEPAGTWMHHSLDTFTDYIPARAVIRWRWLAVLLAYLADRRRRAARRRQCA